MPNEETRVKYRNQFFKTVQEVEEFNSQPEKLYRQTINKFAHLSIEEISKSSLGLSLLQTSFPQVENRNHDIECIPKPIDWRQLKGAVTPVYDFSLN